MKQIYNKSIKRVILIGFIIFFIITGILFSILMNNLYFKSIESLEEADIEQNIEIVKNEIDYRLNQLLTDTADWSRWDEIYLFTEGLNEDFREEILRNDTFDYLNVDLIIISDDSSNLLYGKKKDNEFENTIEIDNVFYDKLTTSGIVENKDPEVSYKDIMIIDGVPVLMGAHPILKSTGSGPVVGNLVFGRRLDEHLVSDISKKLNLGVSFEIISKDEFDNLEVLDKRNIDIKLLDNDYIVGSYYQPVLFGSSYMKTSVKMSREQTKIANRLIKALGLVIPLSFLVILFAFWFYLNKLVISRLMKIHDQVEEIKVRGLISSRIEVDEQSDEISRLSLGINNMLDKVEQLQVEISEANELLEEKVLERTQKLAATNRMLEVEIVERQKVQEEVTYMAYHDSLTGLPNRYLLNEKVTDGIVRARREQILLGIMFIDLDEFKRINDMLGHNQGDELLKQLARRLLNAVRENDIVCRVGGDEFIIYINDYEDDGNLKMIASDIMAVFEEPFMLMNQEYFITGSVGISRYPIDGEDVHTLVKYADMALYHAKSLGKNQYQMCTQQLKDETLEAISLTNDLYQAVERNELLLHYQPQVNGMTGEVVGVEALVRWNHPTFGLVSPFKFIPLAEQTRQIIPIGYWILKTACKQWADWQRKGLKPVEISVNFSVHQLMYLTIIEQIEEVLEKYCMDPHYLVIEITESIAMDYSNEIHDKLLRIKDLGITISLDDFGKEYSSLSRLKELPIDKLKIDMSFVHGIGMSDREEIIIKAILSLASDLKYTTIAEGVETKEQLDFLNQYGCDLIQGYYFYKPMPYLDVEKSLLPKQSSALDNNLNR